MSRCIFLFFFVLIGGSSLAQPGEDSTIRGSKQYELVNHLGNVLATVSDRRVQTTTPPEGASGITADLITATDYYAFGMQMPGRNFSSEDYRFGFGGQEKDNEIAGSGNSYTADFWEYDSRIGKRWNNDPITYVGKSPYCTFDNNPIYYNDPSGKSVGDRHFVNKDDFDKHTNNGENLIVGDKKYGTSTFKSDGTIQYFYDEILSVKNTANPTLAPTPEAKKPVELPEDPPCPPDPPKPVKVIIKKKVVPPVKDDHDQKVIIAPPLTVKVNTPINIDVAFNEDANTFLSANSISEIGKIVVSLIQNPGLKAIIKIGTGYKENGIVHEGVGSPQALVGSRIRAIDAVIDNIAPAGFDKKRVYKTPNFGTNTSATVTYIGN